MNLDEGLRERTPTICQVPTYITHVASVSEQMDTGCILNVVRNLIWEALTSVYASLSYIEIPIITPCRISQ